MIKVVLVDDHVVVRSGFAQLLNMEPDIVVVHEFSTASEAHLALTKEQVDVCVLDISMPDESGLSLLQKISSYTACIMLSVHDTPAMVEKALEFGALGYLSKRCSPDELVQAIRTSVNGGCYLTPDIAQKLALFKPRRDPLQDLTKREKQVAGLLAQGLSVKSIAAQLNLSYKTIHVHRANAMDKLGTANTIELAKKLSSEF